jgi:hypothetical protein
MTAIGEADATVHRPDVSNLVPLSVSALSGLTEEATQLAIETCQIMPGLRVSSLRRNVAGRRPEDLNCLCESWRLAGLPE